MKKGLHHHFLIIFTILFLSAAFMAFPQGNSTVVRAASAPVWQYNNEHWYLMDSNGTALTGWQRVGGKWYYMNGNGVMQTGWQKISGKWYLLGRDGAMKTGWQKVSGKWYYLDGSGAMKTGWVNLNGKWYYLDSSGAMKTGWQKVSGKWYFLDSSGAMKTGWQFIGGKWYFLESSGAMATGWRFVSDHWYYLNKDGDMFTGWLQLHGRWYFLDGSGAMVTGERTIGNQNYLFNSEGVWQSGTGKIVVLDPGHSSVVAPGTVPLGPGSNEKKDADSQGTRGTATGVWEYQLNLVIAQKLQRELEARGYTVYLTRYDNNTPMDCIKRAQVATDKNADIFVRVHANNDPRDASRTGAMTICITPDNPFVPEMYTKSRLLSDKILNTYVSVTGCTKEYVWETDTMTGNNWSTVPTTLIECGYMSNAAEDRRMQDSSYQAKMVQGIADGIDAYFSAVK